MRPDLEAARVPILTLGEYLLVPIQGALDDRMAERLRDELGIAVRDREAHAVIIDVSGVELMDSYLARSIRDTALMAKLMGVETVLCGLGPAIAITLVEMGMDLHGVRTLRDVDEAVACLDGHLRGLHEASEKALRAVASALGREAALAQGALPVLEAQAAGTPTGEASPQDRSEGAQERPRPRTASLREAPGRARA